jgi:hypothetical protein
MVMKPVPEPSSGPGLRSVIPVVGMTHILGQFDAGIAGGSFTGGFCGTGALSQALSHTDARSYPQPLGPHSIRHGPCRAWHPQARSASEGDSPTPAAKPSLRFEGQYENDERTGRWTYYDEQGRLLESGNFAKDRREGTWTSLDPATGDESNTQYVAGRPRAEHDRWMAEADADLASGSLRRQVAAIARLSEVGASGQPRLVELLSSDDDKVKLLALRTLVRQRHVPAEALSAIQPLADHPDPALSVRAKTALYLADPAQRDELLPELVDLAGFDARQELYRETVVAVYGADPMRRDVIVRQVIASLTPLHEPELYYSFYNWECVLANFGPDVIPLLDAEFQRASPDERVYIMAVLQEIIRRDEHVFWSSGVGTVASTIPPAAKPLIERAKADPDVRVRKWAELIGQPQGGMGSGMGTGGGFF